MMDAGAPAAPPRRDIPRLALRRARRPSTSDLRRAAASLRWMAVPAGLALGARLAVFLVATIGVRMVPGLPRGGLVSSWDRWDAHWYLAIARYGYTYSTTTASRANFFPLYPLLVGVAQRLTAPAGELRSYILAGMAVSWVAFVAACVLLYRLALDRFGRRVAYLSVLLLAVFPFAFYFGAPYTESLYLLLAVGAFLAVERKRWWLAGGCALLASAARPPGLILGVCVAVAYLLDWRATRHPARWDLLALGLAPLGTLAYMAYCWLRFGNPLAYVVASRVGWNGGYLQPGGLLMLRHWLAHPNLIVGSSAAMLQGLYTAAILAFCLLVIPIWRALGPHYAIYALASVALPVLTFSTLNSSGRYASVVFPAFIVLALALRRRPVARDLAVMTSSGLLAVLAVLFAAGYPLT